MQSLIVVPCFDEAGRPAGLDDVVSMLGFPAFKVFTVRFGLV